MRDVDAHNDGVNALASARRFVFKSEDVHLMYIRVVASVMSSDSRRWEQFRCSLRVARLIPSHEYERLAPTVDRRGPRAGRTIRYGLFSAFAAASVPKQTGYSRLR